MEIDLVSKGKGKGKKGKYRDPIGKGKSGKPKGDKGFLGKGKGSWQSPSPKGKEGKAGSASSTGVCAFTAERAVTGSEIAGFCMAKAVRRV